MCGTVGGAKLNEHTDQLSNQIGRKKMSRK